MPVRVLVTRDFDHLSETAASIVIKRIIQTLRDKDEFNIGLATGRSPTGLYKHLVYAANRGKLECRKLRSFNLDEYIGLPGENEQQRTLHPESYAFFMVRELFGLLRHKFKETLIPFGSLIDQQELLRQLKNHPQDWSEQGTSSGKAIAIKARTSSAYLSWVKKDILEAYARRIKKCGGIDLQIIGVGGRGHVAFHEAGIPIRGSQVLLVKLDENTVQNAIADGHFASLNDCPRFAVSMGAELVYRAKTVLLLACGARKLRPVTDSLLENPTSDLPISYGQVYTAQGGELIYVVDKTAGQELLRHPKELRDKKIKIQDLSAGRAKLSLRRIRFALDPDTGIFG